MSRNLFPESVLSDALVEAISRRRVKAAVFLTFQFDPGFFEDDILPYLFDQSFSHVPELRRVQMEEALRGLKHLAVYYDRRGLTAEAKPARLDYRRIGLLRHKGCFHPKNIFLLVENHDRDKTWDSLLFVTLSANLTRSGWWENVEVAHIMEVHADQKCTFRSELLDLISRLKKEDTITEEHPALETIRAFLLSSVEEPTSFREQGRWLPRLYIGQTDVPSFLSDFIEPFTYNLEIVSPYFDGRDNSHTLPSLIEGLYPKETRVFLPEDADGTVGCHEGLFNQIKNLSQVHWGLLPEDGIQVRTDGQTSMAQRFVHAKIYRFWNQSREILFVGSVNLTAAAHSPAKAGNFETGVLVETEVTGRLNWWLQKIEEDVPTNFQEASFEETDITEPPCVVTFCFDWETEALSYFWDPSNSAPHQAEVFAQNVPKFLITPIRLGKWVTLPAEAAQSIKDLLTSTSLVEVCVDGAAPFRALVREEGMARKPALFQSLTPEEILHYWSLLSPEQREQFMAYKALMDIDGYALPQTSSPSRTVDSMFDRFAGIFHAFGRLETHVRESLESDHENEAVYRLLGEKHDSLPSLLDKVIKDEEADRVHRYVTLLCATQLLDRIEKEYTDFKTQHKEAFKRVRERLDALDQIEAGFTFETPEIRSEFFTWFREMFFKPAKLPKTEGAV